MLNSILRLSLSIRASHICMPCLVMNFHPFYRAAKALHFMTERGILNTFCVQVLVLSFNSIQRLDGLSELSGLERLDLAHNQIKKVCTVQIKIKCITHSTIQQLATGAHQTELYLPYFLLIFSVILLEAAYCAT